VAHSRLGDDVVRRTSGSPLIADASLRCGEQPVRATTGRKQVHKGIDAYPSRKPIYQGVPAITALSATSSGRRTASPSLVYATYLVCAPCKYCSADFTALDRRPFSVAPAPRITVATVTGSFAAPAMTSS